MQFVNTSIVWNQNTMHTAGAHCERFAAPKWWRVRGENFIAMQALHLHFTGMWERLLRAAYCQCQNNMEDPKRKLKPKPKGKHKHKCKRKYQPGRRNQKLAAGTGIETGPGPGPAVEADERCS